MNTLGWGGPGWDMKFSIALKAAETEYSDDDTELLIEFFTQGTANILPCKWCRIAWTKFNGEETCVVEGCYSSHLKKFIKSIQRKNNDHFFLWLYLMKNKVTNKLKNQEDQKMLEEIIAELKNTKFEESDNEHDISILMDEIKDTYGESVVKRKEEEINAKKNIKRIDRTEQTFEQIKKKYTYLQDYTAEYPDYFPFLFAVAFNAGWSDASKEDITCHYNSVESVATQPIRLINLENKREQYFRYFEVLLPKFIHNKKLQEVLTKAQDPNDKLNVRNFFKQNEKNYTISNNRPNEIVSFGGSIIKRIQSSLAPKTITSQYKQPGDNNCLAAWLWHIFMATDMICESKLPKNFDDVIARYSRWRVSCSKTGNDALPTCRSSTPNRFAPLLK